MSFFEKKSRLLKFRFFRKESEIGFKRVAVKLAWFVCLNRKLLMFTVKFEIKCFAGIDEKTQLPPALGTKNCSMPILK